MKNTYDTGEKLVKPKKMKKYTITIVHESGQPVCIKASEKLYIEVIGEIFKTFSVEN